MRVIFDTSGTILEQNDYYAFGGKHLNSSLTASDNRFKFNGKELQTTGDVDFLDYGARMYDSKIGRWFGQDPAEQFNSPYNFCGNNPVIFVDPNGMSSDWYQNDFGTTFWKDSSDPFTEAWGDSFKNIGSTLSMWDDNLGMFLNYYQNKFLGMSKTELNFSRYITRNNGVLGDLLNRNSNLENKFKIELMELSIQHTRLKFMENSVRAVFGGEHAGAVLTVAGTILAFTPYAPLSPLVLGLGQTYGYGNTAIASYDYYKAGNNGALAYTMGTTVVFGGSGALFKFAAKGSSIYVDKGLQLTNTLMERIVGYGSKTIENKKQ